MREEREIVALATLNRNRFAKNRFLTPFQPAACFQPDTASPPLVASCTANDPPGRSNSLSIVGPGRAESSGAGGHHHFSFPSTVSIFFRGGADRKGVGLNCLYSEGVRGVVRCFRRRWSTNRGHAGRSRRPTYEPAGWPMASMTMA